MYGKTSREILEFMVIRLQLNKMSNFANKIK